MQGFLGFKIKPLQDNLNTQNTSSLYEAFTPTETQALAKTLDIHYTPKHGSWLNIAEIELSVLSSQCLAKMIDDIEKLNFSLSTCEVNTNQSQRGVDWHFKTSKARIKLKRLYPVLM